MLAFILNFLFFINLCLLSFCDWRSRRVPFSLLSILFPLSFLSLYQEERIFSFSPYITMGIFWIGIWVINHFIQWYKQRKDVLGEADIILFLILGLLIKPELISIVLILIGVLGLMSAFIYTKLKGRERFPFCPAICVGIFFVKIYNYEHFKNITCFQ